MYVQAWLKPVSEVVSGTCRCTNEKGAHGFFLERCRPTHPSVGFYNFGLGSFGNILITHGSFVLRRACGTSS